ncbi:YecA family protein [Fictibacillus terranigra]|uniref:SEC-C metal-binding domain-containing protein n=1 Tax=Fictibacillus terranigra TaxID=3058424 RepID=A0ABT8E7H2_9BACL|nr:SEC-C metal-binding domain-containing protein [Fictibacillus sp. CENA-BCM004]MDN4073860.1 SEC-C metal-binding domain-containing protein [Fictibacillus sp. CENA-BCM004]
MNKVGRNEPCPCGSGKKYKNCCLRSVTTVQMNKIVEISSHQEGAAKFAFDHFHEEMGSRTRKYIEQYQIGRDQEQTYANLIVCWLMFQSDMKDGKSPMELYLQDQLKKEQPQIMDVLKSWEKSSPSVYKIDSKINRNTFLLKDVMDGKEYTVEFNSEILPQEEMALVGFLIYTGEHYEFYIDFALIPQGEWNGRLQGMFPQKTALNTNFPHALQALLSKQEQTGDNSISRQDDPILAHIKENAKEEIVNEAEKIWTSWNSEQKLVIRKEEPYAAAIHYRVCKDVLNIPATQSEIASKYGISASSLSSKYRQLKNLAD